MEHLHLSFFNPQRLLMSKFICFGALALAAFSVSLTGCSGKTGTKLVPVSGTVTVDGKPAEGVAVTLWGQSRGEGRSMPFAQSDSAGKLIFKVSPTESGAPVGQYTALFEKMTMPDGSSVPEGQAPADVGAVNQIPEIYNAPSTSPESVTIPEGGTGSLSFDLKTRR